MCVCVCTVCGFVPMYVCMHVLYLCMYTCMYVFMYGYVCILVCATNDPPCNKPELPFKVKQVKLL